jgi:hypothetical protein
MTIQSTLIALAAAGAAFGLAACGSATDASPASATVALETHQALNPDCRPGDTPAGTASGLRCTTGSVTGQWPGIDANVEGASTHGQSIAPPRR